MGKILDWRIKNLDKKVKKLLKEQKHWEAQLRYYTGRNNDYMARDIARILAYIDEDLHEKRKKLCKLRRKLAIQSGGANCEEAY
jgi:hypothetical protein